VVGGNREVQEAAELWRFIPKAFKGYHAIPDPAKIQQRAETELPLDKVTSGWPIGTDPAAHIQVIRELFASGATIVNIHAGQRDQRRVIEFHGSRVLPDFRQPV
jgi:F420-dependent hydroxymycolic acid dehydrogenase